MFLLIGTIQLQSNLITINYSDDTISIPPLNTKIILVSIIYLERRIGRQSANYQLICFFTTIFD